PADEARLHALDRSCELTVLESVAELRERVPQLEAGEGRAEAEGLAHAETDVRVRVAIDAECERIRKHLLVAVRRGVVEAHGLPLPDRDPSQRIVALRRAGEMDDRCHPNQAL